MQHASSISPTNSVGILQSIHLSHKKGLGRKLLIAVLVISSIFTCVQVTYQLYTDYLLGLDEIERRFEQIFTSNHNSLSRSIWDVDNEETLIIGEGIYSLPHVVSVIIKEKSKTDQRELVNFNTQINDDVKHRQFDLFFLHNQESHLIGELQIKINLSPLYNDLIDKLTFILIFQIIKTFSVSILIFTTFHYLVTQHLMAMANYSKSFSKDQEVDELKLNRKPSKNSDELDEMVKALNIAKNNVENVIKYNNKSIKLEEELNQQKIKDELNLSHRLQMEKKNGELEKTISQLKDTQEKLQQSEKMALIGSMVSGVAHELNTPIGTSITAISHLQKESVHIAALIEKNSLKKSALTQFFQDHYDLGNSILNNLNRAAGLIKSFKLVSADQHEDIASDFNLYENLEDILKTIRPSFVDKNIRINNDLPMNINVTSYPGVFYQIYTNLLNNVNLHAFENDSNGEVTLNAVLANNMLTLSITDNGKGMSEDLIEKLFVPFFTTKRKEGATGLGMCIVNALVSEKLQGEIEVTSKLGCWTKFVIKIPNIIYD